MSLVPSLLQAIVSIDGEALVMHAGDKPYVVAPSGQIELASKGLTLEAVNGIVSQLLPPDVFHALDEFGAIQHELAAQPGFAGESFTVVAARGGDDVWVEVRRRKIHDDDRLPEDLFGAAPPTAAAAVVSSTADDDAIPDLDLAPAASAPAAEQPLTMHDIGADLPLAAAPVSSIGADDDLSLSLPDAGQLFGSAPVAEVPEPEFAPPPPVALAEPPAPKIAAPPPRPVLAPPPPKPAPVAPPPVFAAPAPAPPVPPVVPVAPVMAAPPLAQVPAPPVMAAPVAPPPAQILHSVPAPIAAAFPPPVAAQPIAPPPIAAPPAITLQPEPAFRAPAPPPLAPVLPLARSPIRTDTPAPIMSSGVSGLDRLLRMAAARGASTLYLSSHARPSVRVDGEIQLLEGEPSHGPNDVESLLVTMMPERNHEALRMGQATEWITDLEGVGRVRCLSFRDHRGPGGVFRMMPVRAVSTEQLGLTREVQSLAIEPEGIVLIAGPRLSGKRTMISAFIDLMNRTRRDHIITIENEINVVHERGTSFISQREVRGSHEEVEAVARAALREDPDVIVIESMRTAPMINVALEAAASGQLVIGGFPAHDTTTAVDRIINLYPPEYRRQVQLAMAENLRGVVAQVLVRKNGGGRLAAREILLNNPAVAGIIAEGRTSQLPIAIEGGRRQGMQPLNDALAGLVQSGSVDVREAYRRASDRGGFLALLKRLGMDTALIERTG
jgi:twitching motility protein PilT